MKQMIFRQKLIEKNNTIFKIREYLKESPAGWTWDRKYKYYTFPSYKDAKSVIVNLNKDEGFTLGIEPKDDLNYAVIC